MLRDANIESVALNPAEQERMIQEYKKESREIGHHRLSTTHRPTDKTPDRHASEHHPPPIYGNMPGASVMALPLPSLDSTKHQFVMGSRVTFSDPPRYGEIRWMGNFPQVNGLVAGVELVSWHLHWYMYVMAVWYLRDTLRYRRRIWRAVVMVPGRGRHISLASTAEHFSALSQHFILTSVDLPPHNLLAILLQSRGRYHAQLLLWTSLKARLFSSVTLETPGTALWGGLETFLANRSYWQGLSWWVLITAKIFICLLLCTGGVCWSLWRWRVEWCPLFPMWLWQSNVLFSGSSPTWPEICWLSSCSSWKPCVNWHCSFNFFILWLSAL